MDSQGDIPFSRRNGARRAMASSGGSRRLRRPWRTRRSQARARADCVRPGRPIAGHRGGRRLDRRDRQPRSAAGGYLAAARRRSSCCGFAGDAARRNCASGPFIAAFDVLAGGRMAGGSRLHDLATRASRRFDIYLNNDGGQPRRGCTRFSTEHAVPPLPRRRPARRHRSADAPTPICAFAAALYASTRAEELALTGWPEERRGTFLDQQHRAQHHHYRTYYPGRRMADHRARRRGDRPPLSRRMGATSSGSSTSRCFRRAAAAALAARILDDVMDGGARAGKARLDPRREGQSGAPPLSSASASRSPRTRASTICMEWGPEPARSRRRSLRSACGPRPPADRHDEDVVRRARRSRRHRYACGRTGSAAARRIRAGTPPPSRRESRQRRGFGKLQRHGRRAHDVEGLADPRLEIGERQRSRIAQLDRFVPADAPEMVGADIAGAAADIEPAPAPGAARDAADDARRGAEAGSARRRRRFRASARGSLPRTKAVRVPLKAG